MGEPKKQRKVYDAVKSPWNFKLLGDELKLLGEYGLKNKRELRTHQSYLRKIRTAVRETFSLSEDDKKVKNVEIISRLSKLGLIPDNSSVDNILKIGLKEILERRLQTIVFRKGIAQTPYQARQLITHGHILVNNNVIKKPGFFVNSIDVEKVELDPKSTFIPVQEIQENE